MILTIFRKYDILLCMNWKNKTQKRPLFLDYIFSKEIVYDAFREGFLNWNSYRLAIEKINRNINGDWMFVNSNRKNMEEIYK